MHTHYSLQCSKYSVAACWWWMHATYTLSQSLSLSPLSPVQSCTRAFMFAIYKIAIAHIILFLHHRCWIIYTYLQMATNASHADKTKLQLACVFSLIRTPMDCSVLWSNSIWIGLKCTLSCSIMHLGFGCCKMGSRKGGKKWFIFYYLSIGNTCTHTRQLMCIQAACVRVWKSDHASMESCGWYAETSTLIFENVTFI